ncbi:bifunctional hydroxymethylpyrimidine kinase/phosphomethylpyrimidine kinase [Lactiplantibacillus sp. WILCCON 0030]|uniref:Hydroxymethylpyrimidine/phosphomethylpyrimidine kinase n=1 Tax=Lactiplantibacillus brownii TaxID=3069269 RepID=A0ABU1A522_9LACO|nr:bifunctional hydroxymethylpyrimidine kinase/phosphomethylpyrimidine kinase [Lactiplantibacillus brownii]MDQ7936101.1 bifunctional hydroxymethylpyrimidine kinase/phosphomethylpyrimidine kinase [Lactiplantibacillus brownii]
MNEFPEVLTIAGTDSGGGAGIMADLKTMQARHVFGTAVVVAVTAQNTLGVQDFMALPAKLINEQFASLAADFKIRACKTGMLADATHVKLVARALQQYDFGPLIVDPVMIAKGGAALLADDAIETVRTDLLPLATVVTPNLPEAERLTGLVIHDAAGMVVAGHALQQLGAKNVIIKGGHESNASTAADFVCLADGQAFWLAAPRVDTVRTHGTGDTLSACLTAELAKGVPMATAIHTAKAYVTAAIKQTIQVGHGHGPLNHWVAPSDEVQQYDN